MIVRVFLASCVLLTVAGFGLRCIFLAYFFADFGDLDTDARLYALVWGLRFDLAIAAALSLFATLFVVLMRTITKRDRFIFVPIAVAAIIIVATQIGDIFYFDQTGRHIGYEISDFAGDYAGLMQQAFNVDWLLLISIPVISLALVWVGGRFLNGILAAPTSAPHRAIQAMKFLLLTLVTVVFVRGGLSGLPMNPMYSYQIGNEREAVIALNGAYSAIYSLVSNKGSIQQLSIAGMTESRPEVLDRLYPDAPAKAFAAPGSNLNVIIVLLEGWPSVFLGESGTGPAVAPNYDSLRERGLAVEMMLAGGLRTTEGLFSVMCSFQNPLGGTIARTWLQAYDYECLPEVLTGKGYSTAFFQGSHKETSGTGHFAQKLGFEKSYGKSDMPRGRYDHNSWGAHDDDIYAFVEQKITEMQEPFFIAINTNSSHDLVLPYDVQPVFDPAVENARYLDVLHYADAALGRFVRSVLNNTRLAKNTLFIITADHTAGGAGKKPPAAINRFRVPFVMLGPGISSETKARAAHHRDIAPTLLGVLGHEMVGQYSGKNLLADEEAPYFSDFFLNGVLGWVEDDVMMTTNIVTGAHECFDWRRVDNDDFKLDCELFSSRLQNGPAFTKYSQDLLFSGKASGFRANITGQLR